MNETWLSRIINAVLILGLFFAVLGACTAYWWPDDRFWRILNAIVWTLGPPSWFYVEYRYLFPWFDVDETQEQDLKVGQALAAAFWVGTGTLIVTIYQIQAPKPELEALQQIKAQVEEIRKSYPVQAQVEKIRENLPDQAQVEEIQENLPDQAQVEEIRESLPDVPDQSRIPQRSAAEEILALPPQENSIGMLFKRLPGGTLILGSPEGEKDRFENEVQYDVTLTKQFEIGVYEVTQQEYETVMGTGTNPSYFKAERNPVEWVSWEDAVKFCEKLSELPAEKDAGYAYRLPTEAEWEYACRAGTTSAWSFGDSEDDLAGYAWYQNNSENTTHPVGEKKPNPWSLYDMHGNVWEWCHDWDGADPRSAATDPAGPPSGSYRVSRGGCWFSSAQGCGSALRSRNSPSSRSFSQGFRVFRSSAR